MFAHHVLQVNEGVVDGHNLDAFLKASPQHEAANTTEAVQRHKDRLLIVTLGKLW